MVVKSWDLWLVRREDFKVDPYRLRKMLVVHGYAELPVTAEHSLKVDSLPLLHKDPFDRLLLAQARAEGMVLVTGDAAVSQYQEEAGGRNSEDRGRRSGKAEDR